LLLKLLQLYVTSSIYLRLHSRMYLLLLLQLLVLWVLLVLLLLVR
jgi:hypothetical protein